MLKDKICCKIFLLVLCLSFILSALSVKNKIFAVDKAKIIRIGIYDNKPKVYLNDQGAASGLFPDILNYIAKQEDWQLQYVFGTWEKGLARLEKDEIDVMVDVALSKERQDKFDFTNETVFNSWGVVVVHKNSTIDSFQDLDGKKIAILKSSVYYGGPEGVSTYLNAFGLKAEFIEVSKQVEVFNLVNKGSVDAGVVSRVFSLFNQKDYPSIKETELFFSPTELRFALTKASPDNRYLRERLDYWVKKLKGGYGGVYRQILETNGLAGMIPTKEVIPGWIPVAGLASAAIFLLLWQSIIRLSRARASAIQKLRESEEFHRALVEAANEAGIGLVVLQNIENREAMIISVNEQACKISGYSQEEALKMTIQDVMPPDIIKEVLPRYRERQQGKPAPHFYEAAILRKDKTRVPVLLSLATMELHGKPATVAYLRDITEIKKAEEEIGKHAKELEDAQRALLVLMGDLKSEKATLEKVKAKDEAILASIGEGLFVVDLQGKIILVNRVFEDLLGWKKEEALGKSFAELIPAEDGEGNRIPPNDNPILVTLTTEKETAKFGTESDYFLVKKDKSRIPVAYKVTLATLYGEIIGAVGVFRDISEEKENGSGTGK